jgi:glycosyltransferase involved in cell wall biosynthesis
MKVLFVSSWYPTQNNPNYGIFVKEHAKAVQTTSNEIVVLAVLVERSKSILNVLCTDYFDESGIRTIEIRLTSRFRDIIHYFVPLQELIAYYYFKRLISSTFLPDVVHSNVVFPAGVIGSYIARKIDTPFIITEHWSKIAGILKKPILSALVKRTYRHAHRILPVSEYLKKNMQELMPFLTDDKFQIVPNVVDDELFTYREKEQSTTDIRFCAIATWATKNQPDKYPELFIEAISNIQSTLEKKIKLTMIGGGDRVDELKELCRKLHVDVSFVGYQSKSKIAEILQQSDYMLHASRVETFGVVIVESLMTGTPVLCSNVAALPELINDENGVLCENSVESWTNGLVKLLNLSFDNFAISSDVKNVFSVQNIGSRIQSVYESTQILPD